jgi:hypothetical protein
MSVKADDVSTNPFQDWSDEEVEEAYFAAIEHLRTVSGQWWKQYGGEPDVEFDPYKHWVPQSSKVEREQRFLSLIAKARHDWTAIGIEYEDRCIAGRRLQELCAMVREYDADRGYRKSPKWAQVCVLCKECGHRGTATIRDGTREAVQSWQDGDTLRKMRCTNCGEVGNAEAMVV